MTDDALLPCPRCARPVRLAGTGRSPWAPFCSQRCRMVDLGAWSDGDYVVSRTLTYDDLDESEVDERDLGGAS